jgi:hypothetical protein
MKLNKTLMIAALIAGSVFAADVAVRAQDATNTPPAGARPGGRGLMTSDAMLARLEKALGETNKLSEAQLPKVKAAFDDMIKKMTDLRADTTVAQADRAAKRTAIQTETSDVLKAILTPEQFTVYQSLPRFGGGRRGGAGGGGAGGGAPPAGN